MKYDFTWYFHFLLYATKVDYSVELSVLPWRLNTENINPAYLMNFYLK